MTPNSATARQSAKQATRLALVEAALEEFRERGFDAPSLDAICARAGYTRGAFYVHFKNRDELVAAAMEHVLQIFLDEVIARDDPRAGIDETVMRFVDIAFGRTEAGPQVLPVAHLHQLLQACERSSDVRKIFVETVSEGIRRVGAAARKGQHAGRLRHDVDADQMATVLVTLALGAFVAIEVDLPIDVDGARNAALKLLLAGA